MTLPIHRKYFERAPYHERINPSRLAKTASSCEPDDFTPAVYPDMPDDLILAVDCQLVEGDWERLHSDTPGDVMNGYAFGSQDRLNFLAAEHAAERHGVVGLEKLDANVIAILRTQQALGETGLSAAFE